MFLRGHFQNAYVTHDLDKAIDLVSDLFGIGGFKVFTPVMALNTPEGHRTMAIRVAGCWVGGLHIELIQPISGYIDPYLTMLPADRTDASPRFHHIQLRRDDEAEMRREVAELELPIVFESGLSVDGVASTVVYYLDARASFGHYIELSWKTPEMWKSMGWPEAAGLVP